MQGENSDIYQLLLLLFYQWIRETVSFISGRHSVPHLLTQLVLPECVFVMSNMFSCYDRQSLDLDKIQQKYAKLEVLVCLTVFHALPSALSYLTLQCSVCFLLISMVILGIVRWLIYELCFFSSCAHWLDSKPIILIVGFIFVECNSSDIKDAQQVYNNC